MEAPDAATVPPCPPGTDEKERLALGYGATVRNAQNSFNAFAAAADVLRRRGIRTAKIHAMDAESGFAIVEDLGGEDLARKIASGADEEAHYREAGKLLVKLHSDPLRPDAHPDWTFQPYDQLAYRTEAALLHEWYLPKIKGRKLSDKDERKMLEAWDDVLGNLSPPRHPVHRDFHAENVLVTDEGLAVIDFQDMMIGQAAYDWVSLLEDARRDVSPVVRAELIGFGAEASGDSASFHQDFAILAAQRNAKILGIFARLVHRDGKDRYTAFIPRMERLFAMDLEREPVRPVAEVLRDIVPEFFQ
jgi:aminoglycoside/choline kinase family phosphotransferase